MAVRRWGVAIYERGVVIGVRGAAFRRTRVRRRVAALRAEAAAAGVDPTYQWDIVPRRRRSSWGTDPDVPLQRLRAT